MKKLLLVVIVGVAMLPSVTQAGLIISFDMNVSPGHYSAVANPHFYQGGVELDFLTGTVSTADGMIQSNSHENGWSHKAGVFSTFGELKAAAQQPWTIVLDQGLPTERSYTMSLEIDGLQESDIAPPAVSFPSPYETIQTLQPTFEFELLIPRRHSLSLRTFFPSVTLAQTSIASDVTSWSPSVSLQANTEYLFSLRPSNLVFPELGFSAPEDSSGIPLADWDSHIFVSPETNIRFTTAVPEPSAILMVVIGVAVITLYRLRSSQGA